MRVLVCGDRDWSDRALLFARLDEFHARTPITLVIEGEARGADKMSREWAESRGVPLARPEGVDEPGFPANWDLYHKAAGPIRNQQMLTEGRPDYGLAFHDNLPASRGTADMVRRLTKAGIPFQVFTHEQPPLEARP